jgi:colanic acid/amylovoran biosynthesis protein
MAVTTDVAFLLEETKTDRVTKLLESQRPGGSLTVGMALRAYDFPADPQALSKIAEYPVTLAKAIDHLIDVYDASVILMPQVIAPESNDVDFSREVLNYVNRTDRVRVVDEDLTPGELKWLYGRMDAFVGVRMHANIFALATNVPIVAIAYEPKTAGIMRTIGLSDYVLDILTLTEFALKQKIDELLANKESIVAHLKSEQGRMRKTAQMSADVIYDYISAV